MDDKPSPRNAHKSFLLLSQSQPKEDLKKLLTGSITEINSFLSAFERGLKLDSVKTVQDILRRKDKSVLLVSIKKALEPVQESGDEPSQTPEQSTDNTQESASPSSSTLSLPKSTLSRVLSDRSIRNSLLVESSDSILPSSSSSSNLPSSAPRLIPSSSSNGSTPSLTVSPPSSSSQTPTSLTPSSSFLIASQGDFSSSSPASTGSKVSMFKTSVLYSFNVIRSKISTIEKSAETLDSLPELISHARYIRDVKKIIERYVSDPSENYMLAELRTERRLFIKIAEAKNLKPMNIMGTSDPYCTVDIDDERRARTPTKFKELEPMWLQEYTMDVPTSKSSIEVTVWNQSIISHGFMGHVIIDIDSLKNEKVAEQWFHLMPENRKHEVTGAIHINIGYTPEKKLLNIRVIQGRQMRSVESNRLCDPYAQICFANNAKLKTRTQKRTVNPVWNECFQLYLPSSVGTEMTTTEEELDISVWDKGLTKNKYLGGIRIPLSEIIYDWNIPCTFENWFKLFPRPPSKDVNLGSIRLKLHYMEETILPVSAYESFVKIMLDSDYCIGSLLGRAANASEEVVAALVRFYYAHDQALPFLKTVIYHEIQATSDYRLLFRANSVASKAVDCLMKLIGFSYLKKVLGTHVKAIYSYKQSCEMDPTRVEKTSEIRKNYDHLFNWCTKIWESIQNSVSQSPREFREIFSFIRDQVLIKWPSNGEIVEYTAVSGFIFLRFFAPAILGPKSFQLMPEHPEELVARNLTLMSKTIMKLGNLSEYGQKEPFMADMNRFIKEHKPNMILFLESISTKAEPTAETHNEDYPKLELDLTIATVTHHCRSRLEQMQILDPQEPLLSKLTEQLQRLERVTAKMEFKTKRQGSFLLKRSADSYSPTNSVDGK